MKLKNDGPPLRSRSRCSVFTYSCTPQPPHVALRSMPRRDRGKGPRQSSKCEMDAASEGARAWRPSSVVPEESSTTRWWRGLPCRPMIGCAHGKTGRRGDGAGAWRVDCPNAELRQRHKLRRAAMAGLTPLLLIWLPAGLALRAAPLRAAARAPCTEVRAASHVVCAAPGMLFCPEPQGNQIRTSSAYG